MGRLMYFFNCADGAVWRALRLTGATRSVVIALAVTACASPAPMAPHGGGGLSVLPPVTAVEREQLAERQPCTIQEARVADGDDRLALNREVLAYQGLVEEALAYRAKAIALFFELRDKVARGETLSGRDLQRINQGASAMLEQRAALLRVSVAYECHLDGPVAADPEVAAMNATRIAMSLSAALVLYDNYLTAISLYRSDMRLRQHLNRADRGFEIREGELNRIASSFASPDNRARVRRGLIWFEQNGPTVSDDRDEGYRYLVQLIEQSPSRQLVRRARPMEFLGNMFGLFATLGFDSLSTLQQEGIHLSSLFFGNAVGLVEVRRGKLDAQSAVTERVAATVRAGDILLEKTPFRLTDAFIPGHWGHVAIWVGNEAELRALGIWDHAVVKPHQEAIRAGRGVVEALRSGVVANTLAHFLNIDDLAVLRQEDLSDAQRAEVVLQALRQMGKAYDFNFDVRTTDRIVCSELVYHSYVHLDWPTERYLGRVTISPDNVAVRATSMGPLTTVLLYRDGEEIAGRRQEAMEELVHAQVIRLARR